MKSGLLLFCLSLSIIKFADAQVTFGKGGVIIENEKFSKAIVFSRTTAAPIFVASLTEKSSDEQLLATSARVPWFEFVIDHQLITSHDPVWQFRSYKNRELANGGKEVILLFIGKVGVVRGLELEVVEQVFPGATLVREQLVLKTEGKKSYSLNKWEGDLHFIFPQYSFKAEGLTETTQIRLANFDGEVLDSINHSSQDSRSFDNAGDHNLSQAHMFHPLVLKDELHNGETKMFKGPFGIISSEKYGWLMAYEHASQDNFGGPNSAQVAVADVGQRSNIVVDELQSNGARGTSLQSKNERLNFLSIRQQAFSGYGISSINVIRGGYLDGEQITTQEPYSSVWTATAFFRTKEVDQPQQIMHNYMLKWICETPAVHKPELYYNTWGMQRDVQTKGRDDLRGVMTYGNIFKEIERAAELGVDVFVLDDGWEEKQGVWVPNHERLKDGLKPIYDNLKERGIKLGVWLSPLGIDSTAQRYREHPEWVIRDTLGRPVPGQWNHPVFDFVSGFSDLFVEDCKRLIDQGVRFFKWDAIDTHYPYNTKALHGDSHYDKEEVIARYGFLLPIFIKNVMAELTAYNPDVVVEIDLTENERCLVGLAMMSQGKLFWMNNGASGYGDYSQFRAKSMRTIANEYAGIVPLQLFTYANYPQSVVPFFSQRYNVNSSLISGWGFWGNLELLNEAGRMRVANEVKKAKSVMPFIQETKTSVIGGVGASPEIYTMVEPDAAAGQVIAFSGSAMDYEHRVPLNAEHFLAVLNNGYALKDDSLYLHFQFATPDATGEAFILPNNGSGISIRSSTSWLDEAQLTADNTLRYTSGASGVQLIYWPEKNGQPKVSANKEIKFGISKTDGKYVVEISAGEGKTEVRINN